MADDMIGRLNSATKYPPIMTYHSIDPANGKLAEGTALPFGNGPVTLTEKIDGTNGRIVIVPGGDWFIGSREELLYAKEREQISAWRQHGGQEFLPEGDLVRLSTEEGLALIPRLGTVNGAELPETLEETRRFLDEYLPTSRAVLDEAGGGRPEGIVLRTPSRGLIAKARFQDYDRTLNPQPRGKKRD